MLSSADWMERNFFRRIELCFPVNDLRLKRRVIGEGLMPYLADNVQAWEMDGEGGYMRMTRKPTQGGKTKSARKVAQEMLLAQLADGNQ